MKPTPELIARRAALTDRLFDVLEGENAALSIEVLSDILAVAIITNSDTEAEADATILEVAKALIRRVFGRWSEIKRQQAAHGGLGRLQ